MRKKPASPYSATPRNEQGTLLIRGLAAVSPKPAQCSEWRPRQRRLDIETNAVHAAEQFLIPGENVALALDELRQTRELSAPQRRLHTRHLVFVADLAIEEHGVARRTAVVTQNHHAPMDVVPV